MKFAKNKYKLFSSALRNIGYVWLVNAKVIDVEASTAE
jgi:hypothetical protein